MIRNSFLFIILFASTLLSQTRVELSKQVKGALPPSNGGTGLSSCGENEVLVWQSGVFVCSASPPAHAASHKNGGTDEVATATPADNAIPKAGATGTLDIGWIPTVPVSSGGTGATSLTGIVQGNGTSAFNSVAASDQLQLMRRKANTVSTQYEFDSPDTFAVEDFSWSQSPSQTLTSSTLETVTLSPCPLGVDGSNSDHVLRITDAVSGNENVTMTGGSCTSGLSSGTIQFTPTLNHTNGNWSIGTATGGLQEGVFFVSAGQALKISGDLSVFAETTITKSSIAIIGNQPGSPGGSRILPQSDGQNVFDITTAAGFQKLHFANFEIDGFFAVNDVGFRAILANGLTFDNVHFNLIKAYDLDRVNEVYIHNTVVGSDVDAFFGSTVDTTHSFDIMIDGWIQRSSSPYTISGPLLHFQRAVSVVLTGVNYRGLSNVPVAIQFSNDCQGNSITDSTVVNATTGIKLVRNTVGSTTTSPSWNRIDNFMCDGCAAIGIDVENGSLFNTITQAYFTTIDPGDSGIILRAGSQANIITGSVFQNMKSGGTGITVEAGVSEFAIADSYFPGFAGSTGIDIQPGASDAYNIIGNITTVRLKVE